MRRVAALLLVLLLAGCATPAAAPVQRASEPAPDRILVDESGTNWEPHVAVDPRDAQHVAVATRVQGSGRLPASFVLWFDVHVTRDGGRSWNVTHLRYTSPLGEGDAQAPNVVGDPVLAFLPDGTLLATGATLRYTLVPPGGVLTDVRLYVTRSTDGGATFEPPVVVARSEGIVIEEPTPLTNVEAAALLRLPDKPWLATSADGTAILTWSDILAFHPQSPTGQRSDIVLSESRDAGRSWSAPRLVARGGTLQGSSPAVGADGAWYVAYVDLPAQMAHVAVSRDRGASWTDRPVAPSAWMPSLATARDRLFLAVPTPAGRGSGDDVPQAPTLLRSDDGGATWSAPLALDAPDAPGRSLPSVAADAAGVAYVTYAHAVSGTASQMRATIVAQDGRVSNETLDAGIRAPTSRLGDYLGLGAGASGAFAVWTTTRPDGRGLDTAGAWLN